MKKLQKKIKLKDLWNSWVYEISDLISINQLLYIKSFAWQTKIFTWRESWWFIIQQHNIHVIYLFSFQTSKSKKLDGKQKYKSTVEFDSKQGGKKRKAWDRNVLSPSNGYGTVLCWDLCLNCIHVSDIQI